MAKCIDTSLWIPYLVPEPLQSEARSLITPLLLSGEYLVAPGFAWAEVGSVLRKKVRLGLITAAQAAGFYDDFCQMPINYLDSDRLHTKTWQLAETFDLATLYDAAFLAVADLESAEFWTADQALVNTLNPCPTYVHLLTHP
ncbi:type II toxin-antitoxin system VapC family toxin [Phormidium tenue]|uniref:Twitching motility protein PilT n=1 Tax=Phormidium tenue NIES-30 TaxID=549789 RepID=A0A1U7JAL3_9CYAN|nr:type II toxin-antitoxin system VapC family toxin [Phormidium tenue]MBD2230443.1 type II toxin-antitoxin system VapC family toxin [Phormidium tenue FACHB-1052]OKH50766.1 twitching motility protein PilT [Phormidium tenue NIES-30]